MRGFSFRENGQRGRLELSDDSAIIHKFIEVTIPKAVPFHSEHHLLLAPTYSVVATGTIVQLLPQVDNFPNAYYNILILLLLLRLQSS